MPQTAETMALRLNGEERRVPAGLTVQGLLEHLGLDPRLVVVEHNRAIVERARYGDRTLTEGDTVELVHFVGGG